MQAIRVIVDEHRALAAVLHGMLYLVHEIRDRDRYHCRARLWSRSSDVVACRSCWALRPYADGRRSQVDDAGE
jgi:hypothetical protein